MLVSEFDFIRGRWPRHYLYFLLCTPHKKLLRLPKVMFYLYATSPCTGISKTWFTWNTPTCLAPSLELAFLIWPAIHGNFQLDLSSAPRVRRIVSRGSKCGLRHEWRALLVVERRATTFIRTDTCFLVRDIGSLYLRISPVTASSNVPAVTFSDILLWMILGGLCSEL